MKVEWNYFDKFGDVIDRYLPNRGQGSTKATQVVTAINKIIYKFYNDGDVFDNQYYLEGFGNDLSSYANWLKKYIPGSDKILDRIYTCRTEDAYSELLADLADTFLTSEFLDTISHTLSVGDIYECSGPFEFVDKNLGEEYDEFSEYEDAYGDEDDEYYDDGDDY